MSRAVPFVLLVLLTAPEIQTLSAHGPGTPAQGGGGGRGGGGAGAVPARDPMPPPQNPAQPSVRRIPVGSAVISGAVVDGATGRPIADVRIMLSGSTMPADGARGSGAGPVGAPVAIGGTGGTGSQVGQAVLSLSRTAVTDSQGRYSFERLPAGQFSVNATRNQYLTASYGQSRPSTQGTAIRLDDGQRFVANLQMHRGGVISGTILGENGEPEMRAQVRALRVTMTNGVKRLQQTGSASTDDRGAYRMFGLQPGEYVIAAQPLGQGSVMSERQLADSRAIEQAIASGAVQPPAGPGLPATVSVAVTPPPQPGMIESPGMFLPTYYPATLSAGQATVVAVGPNTERSGIDLQVQRALTSSIDGMVALPPLEGVAVQISLISEDALLSNVMSTRPGQDGRFQFRGIAPGKYTVFASTVPAPQTQTFFNGVPSPVPVPAQPPRIDDAQRLWGKSDVNLDPQSTAQVSMSLQPGRSISGVLLFEMERPPDLTRTRFNVMLNQAPSSGPVAYYGPQPQAQVQPDGRFTINGVIPGTYILRASGAMKSSVVNGQDTLDFPLEFDGLQDIAGVVLTMSDRSTELTGVVTDAAGGPASEYTIIAAAADSRFWIPGSRRIVTARPDTSGRYAFRGLPPGDYVLAALTDLEPGRQFDPELLRTIAASSVRVTLAEGAKLSQGLRVGR